MRKSLCLDLSSKILTKSCHCRSKLGVGLEKQTNWDHYYRAVTQAWRVVSTVCMSNMTTGRSKQINAVTFEFTFISVFYESLWLFWHLFLIAVKLTDDSVNMDTSVFVYLIIFGVWCVHVNMRNLFIRIPANLVVILSSCLSVCIGAGLSLTHSHSSDLSFLSQLSYLNSWGWIQFDF